MDRVTISYFNGRRIQAIHHRASVQAYRAEIQAPFSTDCGERGSHARDVYLTQEGESPKQGLTYAGDLTIELLGGTRVSYHRLD